MHHRYDVLVVGAGGAGLMAALYAAKGNVSVACISKLYPTRSHTGAAQGGIGAALGNVTEDHWEWHMFDTVKGGDYLTDQDAAEIFSKDIIEAVYELEHMGLPFSRLPDGKIAQRKFGGHTRDFGKAAVERSCYAQDRTGHMILQTLYQQNVKAGTTFYNEFHVTDLIIENGRCCGVVAYHLATGEIHTFHAKAVILAAGGYGRVYKITSNALTLTGDLMSIYYRKGLPLEDMEFYQFHPTGLAKLGILVTEGIRGEGGILRNSSGERFMERYAPTIKDLAPRDIVSRSIITEIREGRGVGRDKDAVHIDLTHLPREVIEVKLAEITDLARTYLGQDPVKDLVAVQPTAHYAMGGIPTDVNGLCLADGQGTKVEGLYAAGEQACVSLHGANRLGTNSLGDLIVFGRRAGIAAAVYARQAEYPEMPENPEQDSVEMIARLRNASGKDNSALIRKELQESMMNNVGIFRNGPDMEKQVEIVKELKERYKNVAVTDPSVRYNSELIEAMELGFMLDCAEAATASALNRQESRGAHDREDYPERDDQNWLKHTMAYKDLGHPGNVVIGYKEVALKGYTRAFEPKPRVY
ncbi:succinate dehydrogenase flavoprotein subunit [Deinococcus metallilatus]|uniref:Succinate dehydrogenase flavoprotein subunit n=2 Tax=Deinococcus TaxID=1298 RepID=A0AAJ5F0E9_9DEIO|nr:succinate dehydrogenase flavoprotein subunit [Deinococcus metallilatus]MBB5295287.1 succinate dehydrogenase / fumarate reductase flavoprotein subunit [Deinococcus metallilatus]QBY08557.1 succinate dehydrogenase flavoprotein subunit [Deinococcus metallilatus]RXJ10819.1 succinate dehydrogenase flavoprotein subunit [Deinococcus metallilatus]TLK22154.1 succinate dehydrogenase flavoprotein subunit [Deinococcus metallilatus]GMA15062.1 succinate dehydrogenase flavoprotein subunit [Deinococcus meta